MKRIWILAALLVGCPEDDPPGSLVDASPPGVAVCAFDDSEDPETAAALTLGMATEGAICPLEDVDWYAFSTATGVIAVDLAMDPALSPVEPTYIVRSRMGTTPGDVVATPRADEIARALSVTHCVAPGDYFIAVRDAGDDAEDRRGRYVLSVEERTDPDGQEPNQTSDTATALANEATGFLACRGDADWYAIDVDDRQILDVHVTMPIATVEPRLRIVNPAGDVVFDEAFGAAGRMATDLRRAVAVTDGGRWHIVISDADDDSEDIDTPYTVRVTTTPQLDVNEPNDTAATATVQPAVDCGADWTEWVEVQGTFGTVGDPDWFRIPVSSCAGGIIEATISVDVPADQVQASVALVRPHRASPCSRDEECRTLTRECGSDWDCAGFFNTCLQGQCAGATACLAEEVCGAFVAERHHTPGLAMGPNAATLVAPMYVSEAMYLRVGDFAGDGASPEAFYTLRYRLRDDPDQNEPSNVYTPTLMRDDPDGIQVNFAVQNTVIPVHDCTAVEEAPEEPIEKGEVDAGMPVPDMGVDQGVVDAAPVDAAPVDAAPVDAAPVDAAPVDAAPVVDARPVDAAPVDAAPVVDARLMDAAPIDAGPLDAGLDMADAGADMAVEPPTLVPGCCGPDDWIEGWISYQADQDWYAYAHPCPGEDCMVRIRYEIDGGPVDTFLQVYRGTDLWFDTVLSVEEAAEQRAMSGAFGGIEPADQCFYAYNGHTARGDERYYYTIRIRDLLPTVDWSTSQRYRFCVEKVAAGCSEPPCLVAENGCETP